MDRKSFSVCLANLTCRCGIMLPILLVIINNDVSMKVFFTSRLLAIYDDIILIYPRCRKYITMIYACLVCVYFLHNNTHTSYINYYYKRGKL